MMIRKPGVFENTERPHRSFPKNPGCGVIIVIPFPRAVSIPRETSTDLQPNTFYRCKNYRCVGIVAPAGGQKPWSVALMRFFFEIQA